MCLLQHEKLIHELEEERHLRVGGACREVNTGVWAQQNSDARPAAFSRYCSVGILLLRVHCFPYQLHLCLYFHCASSCYIEKLMTNGLASSQAIQLHLDQYSGTFHLYLRLEFLDLSYLFFPNGFSEYLSKVRWVGCVACRCDLGKPRQGGCSFTGLIVQFSGREGVNLPENSYSLFRVIFRIC